MAKFGLFRQSRYVPQVSDPLKIFDNSNLSVKNRGSKNL